MSHPDDPAAPLPIRERASYITDATPTQLPPVPEGPAPGGANAATAQLAPTDDAGV